MDELLMRGCLAGWWFGWRSEAPLQYLGWRVFADEGVFATLWGDGPIPSTLQNCERERERQREKERKKERKKERDNN